MNYTINPQSTYSLAHAPAADPEVVTARISADLHRQNSLAGAAARRVYTDALLAGCGTLDRARFLDRINSLGASVSVDESDGVFSVSLRARSTLFPRLLTLITTMLENPTFSAAEVRRIKRTAENELSEHSENARARALELLRGQLFSEADRRHCHTPKALAGAVKAVSRRDLSDLHAQTRAAYWHVSIVGPETARDTLARTLMKLKRSDKSGVLTPGAHEPAPAAAHVALCHLPSKQNIEFSIGGPLPLTIHHPEYPAFVFGLNVLSLWGGFAGRLMNTVRAQAGYTYMIYGRTEAALGSETGYWRIATFFSTDVVLPGLAATAHEISRIHREGITADEHAQFRAIHRTRRALVADSPQRILDELHAFHCEGFSPDEIDTYRARFDALEREAVNAALATYLDPAATYIAGAGPTDHVQKELTKRYRHGIL